MCGNYFTGILLFILGVLIIRFRRTIVWSMIKQRELLGLKFKENPKIDEIVLLIVGIVLTLFPFIGMVYTLLE